MDFLTRFEGEKFAVIFPVTSLWASKVEGKI